MSNIRLVCLSLTVLLFSVAGAAAQLPPPTVTVTPHPNPSSSLVLPAPGETPVYRDQPARLQEPSGPSAATSPAPTKWSTRRAACCIARGRTTGRHQRLRGLSYADLPKRIWTAIHLPAIEPQARPA